MRLIVTVLLSFIATQLSAQTPYTGELDYPYLGIKLTIPEQWKGAEEGNFLILGSDTEKGLIGLTVNEATHVSELKQVADAGWIDDGISMQRSSDFVQLGAEGMAAEFSGYFQGQKAKAWIAGVINPHGNSLTIIALTSAEEYGPRQPELVKEIVNSLRFALPKEAEHNAEWRKGLAGRQLSYRYSSSSSGPDYYDAYGSTYSSYTSYSSSSTIHLCSDQSFYSSSNNSSSFDAVGGFGAGQSRSRGDGQWQVTTSSEGESILKLNYADGTTKEYKLDYRDGKTYLNSSRYFRTSSETCS